MKGAVIDLDGTVYQSESPIPDAREGIETLRDAGVDVAFVSNTSTKSRAVCLERLAAIDIEAELTDIVTSASVTAAYVAAEYPGATAMVIGQQSLLDEFSQVGVALTEDPLETDVLVVGKDRSFDFDALTRALHALERGATFVATNRDRKSPTDRGNEPGSGSFVAAVGYAADREPDVVAGKPHEPIVDVTLDRLGVGPSECMIIGDNPEMDVEMGDRTGMTTVLVLTGLADRTDPVVRNGVPDHVIETMAEIDEVLAATTID